MEMTNDSSSDSFKLTPVILVLVRMDVSVLHTQVKPKLKAAPAGIAVTQKKLVIGEVATKIGKGLK